jgi:hypothetical protein
LRLPQQIENPALQGFFSPRILQTALQTALRTDPHTPSRFNPDRRSGPNARLPGTSHQLASASPDTPHPIPASPPVSMVLKQTSYTLM